MKVVSGVFAVPAASSVWKLEESLGPCGEERRHLQQSQDWETGTSMGGDRDNSGAGAEG